MQMARSTARRSENSFNRKPATGKGKHLEYLTGRRRIGRRTISQVVSKRDASFGGCDGLPYAQSCRRDDPLAARRKNGVPNLAGREGERFFLRSGHPRGRG